ncbi:PTS sugar transporter subunit IIA [Fusobacterium necrophorum]|nr:PTS sugar transporter subunit IIA [Fusobacterium necrophorum]
MLEKKNIFRFTQKLFRDEVLKIVGNQFYEDKIVNEKFVEVIQKKEREFPTGIVLQGGMNTAIVHTDDIYVLKDKIALVISEEPILFKNIENGKENICCHIFFVMALTRKNKNEILSFMAELLEKHEEILKNFQRMTDEEILEVLL